LIELGVPEGHAAHAIGVTPQTFINWKHRGENYNPDNGTREDYIFYNLLNEIDEAKARFVEKNVRRIDTAANKDPNHAQWLLERRDADNFAKREPSVIIESKVLIALQERMATLREVKQIEAGNE